MKTLIRDKNILVTGGTGSIGSEVVRQLLAFKPKVIRIFSRDEYKQFMLKHELGERKDVRFLLGDVRDLERMKRAFEGVDYVFHCAALKHVPFCEYNAFEAVQTNVLGTENVINAALANDVRKVINISTDKAVNPMNVLGATKLLAERLVSSAKYSEGHHKTQLASVRFGNVFGSRGSVVPLFVDQVKQGGPVTITDTAMTRFFMSIPQAVKLVFRAMKLMQGGELFILKMPVVRLSDVMEVVIEQTARRFGHDPKKIKRKIIGSRPGERMYEVLMTAEEAEYAYVKDSMFIVAPPVELPVKQYGHKESFTKQDKLQNWDGSYSSEKVPVLSRKAIAELLHGQGLI